MPPPGLNVPTGANLTHGATTVLTVGSDCAIGKMTVSLELDREARRRGWRSEFVPTGQTGIAIAGWGISVDAVVADFIAGAAESSCSKVSSVAGEVLFVEGQGSLLHPAYSGVTLGLIHGARHTPMCCVTRRASDRRRERALSDAAAQRVRRAARADQPAAAAGAVLAVALNTRCSTTMPRGARSRRPKPRRDCRQTIRCGSARAGSWMRSNR